MKKNKKHPSHKHLLPRLNRVIGQLEGIKKMIDEQRYCPDILLQLKAARSAIKSVEGDILKTHLEHCVVESFNNKDEAMVKILEIKQLLDRIQN